MNSRGKENRIKRIIDPDTKTSIILPMDHGSWYTTVGGINTPLNTVKEVTSNGANSVLGHKGFIRKVSPGLGKDVGTIMQLTCSSINSPNPNSISKVSNVIEAVKMGVDAVSAFITIENEWEKENLHILGEISEACDEFGVPLVAMMEEPISGIEDVSERVRYLKHACRLGSEFGADVIKTTFPGDKSGMEEIVEVSLAPVVIAGGPKADTNKGLLQTVKNAMDVGAIGTSIGRNIFQHENPGAITRAIKKIVRENAGVNEALQILEKA